jgi:hypothetical protein
LRYGGLFVHENGKEVFYMMGANGAVLFSLLIYAALLYGAVRLIKYFIRYGIDYYFEKLAEYQKNQKHTED